MKNLKILTILIILFFIYIFLSAKSYSSFVFDNLSNEVLRLHIVANSNSAEDQYLKLKIRDNILNYLNNYSNNFKNKNDVISFINTHNNEISDIINSTILESGYNYCYSFQIDNCYFPTKNYGNITFPLGNYDCLNIKIGNANGENWWCVMFPPVCINTSSVIVDESSQNILKDSINNESFSIVTSESTDYKIKFKILEIFNSL